MEKRICAYIKSHIPQLGNNTKIIVALSGGADSVCLLHILQSFGYHCIAAHCNFHLRGDESMRDEYFVTNFCQQLGCKLLKINFATEKYAQEKKISIEMAARELRYAWFEKILTEQQADFVAVAHHADDVVETFLMNLTRGTGLNGLTGIKPVNGNIIRPLLCVGRTDILKYLQNHQLDFVEDSSNTDTHFVRNNFRHNVIPMLTKINPSVRKNILQTIECLAEAEQIQTSYFKEAQASTIFLENEGLKIDIESLKLSKAPQSFLHQTLSSYGFSSHQCRQIWECRNSESGRCFYSAQYQLTKDRNFYIISPKIEENTTPIYIDENCRELFSPIHLKIEKIENDSNFVLEKSKNIGYFDLEKIKFPLTLRTWKKGDSFFPLGMNQKKKLSDFFINNKLSLTQKNNTKVLLSDNQIMWIVGLRLDNRFKITENTRFILKITL